jgi:glycosyltransferase involved in cell wall biosynthesis
MKASVIISFYQKIEYLNLVLAGFERQTERDFEIIIADDGSNSSVVNQIEELSRAISFPVLHVWHEDRGFRKNKILNRAVVSSNSDYLIFIDGDCVPHFRFVEEHLKSSNREICSTGRRVNLSQKFTDKLREEKVQKGYLEKNINLMVFDGLFGKSNYVEKGFYVKNNFLRKIFNKKKRGLLGCNFSLFKEDMLSINGFDERYEAPSIGEDSDIQFRLELNGVKIKPLNNIAVQYHLYHKLQPRLQKNLDLYNKIKSEKFTFTKFGIKK